MTRVGVLLALAALALGAPSAGAQATCDSIIRPQTDSLLAETYRRSSTGTPLATRKTVVRRLASRIDTLAGRCLTPADTTQPPADTTPPPPAPNKLPVADFTHRCSARPDGVGADCTFDGSASSDADGVIAVHEWTATGRPARLGVRVTYPYPIGHKPTISLTVTDDSGATSTKAVQVTITVDSAAPAPAPVPAPQPAPAPAPVPPPAGSVPSNPPTLPQATVDVSWRAPTGRTWLVDSGGNLQGVLDLAQRGDEVVIESTARFTGTYTVRARVGAGWITVRTGMLSGLPPLGKRIDSTHFRYMPTIQSPVPYAPAIDVPPGVSGYRFVGLNVTLTPNATSQFINYAIFRVGEAGPTQTTVAQAPADIILDRMYVHGQPQSNTARCVSFNGVRLAVVSSLLLECHGKGFDSQAIAAWNGPGPFLIENNRLEAGAEVIMFGGAIASIPNLVASDITIRRNFLTRPMSWQGVWTVKNLFELKNAQRVLVEANVMENHWVDAQAGHSIMLGTLDNPCSWCIVSDVTFQWNHIHNVAGGFNLVPNYGNAQPMRRVKIAQNLITGLGAPGLGANGKFMLVQDNVDDVWIEHNSGFGTVTYVDIGDEPQKPKARFTFRHNIGGGAQYNWFSSQGQGDAALAANLTSPYLVAGNCLIGTAQLPTGTTVVANLAAVRFVNPSWPGGDWSLGAGSPCAGAGVDFPALQAKLAGVR